MLSYNKHSKLSVITVTVSNKRPTYRKLTPKLNIKLSRPQPHLVIIKCLYNA